ncbi:MAG: gliding motility-associated C-terminal domain-containing protein [Flavobacteriales bacterium]|jgi:gliding motility-associated-like protein
MRPILLCLALVLCGILANAQYPSCRINPEQATSSFFSNRSEWLEVLDKRDGHHALWQHPDGRIMMENSQKPIHFRKNQRWERINPEITPSANGWSATHQPHPIRINNDGSFHTDFGQEASCHFAEHTTINNQTVDFNAAQEGDNRIVASSSISWLTKSLHAGENQVKYNYHFAESPVGVGNFTTITESITCVEANTIETLSHEGQWINGLWHGPLHFMNADNRHVATIMPVVCFDDSEQWGNNSTHITAGYSWSMEQNRVLLSMHIPNTWLNDASRNYPVTIDPLVIGPTASFGNNLMLSCFIPDYYVDSITITIPAQVTITGCFVTTSFFANALAGSLMEDGSMYFSTACDTSETFEVEPPNGAQAGTAYLELFDFRNPLLCCFAPSCDERTFPFRMHLGRYTPEGDCNYANIYYDPNTLWPFIAYVEGRTAETYGIEWSVPGAAICSSTCEFEGKMRTKYGVPPYTITHPWMDQPLAVEEPTGCDISGKITDVTMVWPDCPIYCPEAFSLEVPPPIVTDACGSVVEGLAPETLNIKAAPSIVDPSPVQVCSDITEYVNFQSCAPEYSITWSGNGESGDGYNLPITLSNNDTLIATSSYLVHANWNGCTSDTLELMIEVLPSPQAAFNIAPNPAMQGIPAFFIDQSTTPFGQINGWWWTLDGELQQYGDITDFTIADLGFHTMCLHVSTDGGCPDTLCKDFEVVTPRLTAPNVFTPNGDDANAQLVFDQLEFYPSSKLSVWNRWGVLVYEQENYQNNWDGGDLPDGTYYYILDVEFYGQLASYFQIMR